MENLIKLKCFRDSLNENELRLLHSLEHGQWIPISKLGVLLTRHGIYKKKSTKSCQMSLKKIYLHFTILKIELRMDICSRIFV